MYVFGLKCLCIFTFICIRISMCVSMSMYICMYKLFVDNGLFHLYPHLLFMFAMVTTVLFL